MAEASVSGNNKRFREEESLESELWPEAKRLHNTDFLLDILDDDEDDANSGDRDLASVMKSLEEEISLPPPTPPEPVESASDLSDPPRLAELGYLLEASDDELGLPPVVSSSSSLLSPELAQGAGFGQIWSFDDDMSGCYDALGFGIRPAEEDGVVLDDGLFDYADVVFCGPSDFSRQAESVPAI